MSCLAWRGLALLCLLGILPGCESLEKKLFMRQSPAVDRAVTALNTRDAGVAALELTEYLSTGRCKNGSLGTPERIREYPNATFDLGLTLFQLAERFGARFGEAPSLPGVAAAPGAPSAGPGGLPPAATPGGGGPEAQALLARRSQEVDCALMLVRVIAADNHIQPELRAQAYYLSGNLEFLRHDYEAAVQSYDDCLRWVPGGLDEAQHRVGTDAAWNRAIALKRIQEEEENKPPQPDAGSPPPSDAGGSEQPSNDNDKGKDPDEQNNDADKQNSDPDKQNKEQDDQQKPEDQDQQAQDGDQDQPEDQQDQNQPDQPQQDQNRSAEQPNQQQAQEQGQQPPPPSLSQDERILQQLEQAPMLQNEVSKSRARGRVRLSTEDK